MKKTPRHPFQFIATAVLLASGLQGCGDASAPPKDAAADPATVAAGKAVQEKAEQKAGKKATKSVKELGK